MKSHRQMNRSVQQAAFLDAWISTIRNSDNLKGHILNVTSSTSEICRLPRRATSMWDFTAGDFFKPCASLPSWPMRSAESASWNIPFCFLWQAIILICQTAKSVVACLLLNGKNRVIGSCLDSLGREVLSQCLYVCVCNCMKETQTIQKPAEQPLCTGAHLSCPALTQLQRIQPGILQGCLKPTRSAGLFAQNLSARRALHLNLPGNWVGWLFSPPILS